MNSETMSGFMNAAYMNDGWAGAGHHGWGLMHGPFSILLVIGFILLLVWLFRRGAHGSRLCGTGAGSALATLSERFAKGEIDEEEFRSKREVLKSKK
jgi:putative membrane protein